MQYNCAMFLANFYHLPLIINIHKLHCTPDNFFSKCAFQLYIDLCNKIKDDIIYHVIMNMTALCDFGEKFTSSPVLCNFSSMKCMFKTPSSVGSNVSRKRRLTQLTGIDLNETDISWTESLATPSTSHPAKWGKSD